METKTNHRGAPRGNKNAAKDVKRSARVVVYVTPLEKEGIDKQAAGKISPWARRKLGLPK